MIFQPCDVENIEDFSRYYSGSFMPFRGNVYQISRPYGGRVVLIDRRAEVLQVEWEVFARHSSFGIPTLGIRNLGPTICWLYTAPARNSNRGYIPNHCFMTQFNSWEHRRFPKPGLASFETAHEVYFPKFYGTSEALDLLGSGERVGCAINENVGLFTTDRHKFPLIAFKRQTVGYMDGEPHIKAKFERVFKSICKGLGVSTISIISGDSNIRRTVT